MEACRRAGFFVTLAVVAVLLYGCGFARCSREGGNAVCIQYLKGKPWGGRK